LVIQEIEEIEEIRSDSRINREVIDKKIGKEAGYD